MRGRRHYFEGDRPRVEVIPMIDIMMFLLVFFVVISLRMIAGTGIAMELPGSATTQQIKTSSITVGVTKSGETVLDGNGLIEGRSELFPLFESAARDYTQPLFSYGAPRLFRLGVELLF